MTAPGQPFVGPIASPQLPEQPSWSAAWCARWNAFDVPRLWDMLAPEGNEAVWSQVGGFRRLADVLEEYYRLLRTRRDRIAQAWQAPSAERFLELLDRNGTQLLSDAGCSRQTAYALDSTVSALVKAREQMRPLTQQWQEVTTRWWPDWWNREANRLNQEARQIMVEADKALAAARPKITAPDPIDPIKAPDFVEPVGAEPGGGGREPPGGTILPPDGSAGRTRMRVPPVPGYDPVVTGSAESAELQNAPKLVLAQPGTPVSMLPIPPGSSYAPNGGAYILPGPGVGPASYVVPMPPSSPGPGSGGGRPGGGIRPMPPSTAAAGSGGMGPAGMMPIPMTGGPGAGAAGHGALYRRPNIVWQVDKGVPPVIEVAQDEFVPDQPTLKQEEEFRGWFDDLAYPWRAEFKNDDGTHVTVRTVAP
ncbi:MAG TPA: hypothetical protein VF062_17465 [Candidatus Limnocylindrales bacterium]